MLHPQCYVLKDIVFDSREDSGGFCDIYRGHRGGRSLCLKVVRIHQKSDTDAVLRVCFHYHAI